MLNRLLVLLVCVTLPIVAADKKDSQSTGTGLEVFSYFAASSMWNPEKDPLGRNEDGTYVLFHDEKERDWFARAWAYLTPEERWAKTTLAQIVLEHEAAQAKALSDDT